MKSLTKLPLKYVHAFPDRHDKKRHYFRRAGRKQVPLPGLPGSAEFMEAYQAALAGDTAPWLEIGAGRSKPGSVAAAVASYFQSKRFVELGPNTQRVRRRILERFREDHGDKPIKSLERRYVDAMLAKKIATPHAARHFLIALREVIAVAIMNRLRDDDPTLGMSVTTRETDGFKTWSEDEIAQFKARHPIDSRAGLALGLLLYTAQRRGDVIRMGRQDIDDGFIRVRQQKTGPKLIIPLLPDLQEILAAHPAEHLTFLTTMAGAPFTAAGFTNWFRDRCREAGLPPGLSAHGLRKAACRRFAEAGCTVHQIAAFSGRRRCSATRKPPIKNGWQRTRRKPCRKTRREQKLANLDQRLANFQRKRLKIKDRKMMMASRKGFEPLTYGLGNRCSILLSYRDNPTSDPKPRAPGTEADASSPGAGQNGREHPRSVIYTGQRLVSR
jgi:integrase